MDSITLIDTSEAVVRQLKHQLEDRTAQNSEGICGSILFISSKDEDTLLRMAQELMSSDLSGHTVLAKHLGEL